MVSVIIVTLIFFIIFIIVGLLYYYNNDTGVNDSQTDMVNVLIPTNTGNQNYNYIQIISSTKGVNIDISKLIIIDIHNNVVIPKNVYNLKANQSHNVNGKKTLIAFGKLIITFDPCLIKSISISGNSKKGVLNLLGGTIKVNSSNHAVLDDSYTQVINFNV